MGKDYYKILGVGKNATDEDIKKAYRSLAHKYHPDKAEGDETRFKEINEAYQILSDRNKRTQYDRFGRVFDGQPGMNGQGPNPFNQGFGFNFEGNLEDLFGLGDIFDTFFEGFGMSRRRKTYQRGSDIEIVQEISLEEAFKGVFRKLNYNAQVVCGKCGGVGYDKSKGVAQCSMCGGKGEIRENRSTFFGNVSQIKICSQCKGAGETPVKICPGCSGTGRAPGRKETEVVIMPGIESGQIVKIRGAGEAGERGSASGDLYVIIKVKPHSAFERKASDLFKKQEVKLTDALLNKEISFRNIDGENIKIRLPWGLNVKERLRIPAKGMPRLGGSQRGDLYLDFDLKLPSKISSKAKKIIEELDKEI